MNGPEGLSLHRETSVCKPGVAVVPFVVEVTDPLSRCTVNVFFQDKLLDKLTIYKDLGIGILNCNASITWNRRYALRSWLLAAVQIEEANTCNQEAGGNYASERTRHHTNVSVQNTENPPAGFFASCN